MKFMDSGGDMTIRIVKNRADIVNCNPENFVFLAKKPTLYSGWT